MSMTENGVGGSTYSSSPLTRRQAQPPSLYPASRRSDAAAFNTPFPFRDLTRNGVAGSYKLLTTPHHHTATSTHRKLSMQDPYSKAATPDDIFAAQPFVNSISNGLSSFDKVSEFTPNVFLRRQSARTEVVFTPIPPISMRPTSLHRVGSTRLGHPLSITSNQSSSLGHPISITSQQSSSLGHPISTTSQQSSSHSGDSSISACSTPDSPDTGPVKKQPFFASIGNLVPAYVPPIPSSDSRTSTSMSNHSTPGLAHLQTIHIPSRPDNATERRIFSISGGCSDTKKTQLRPAIVASFKPTPNSTSINEEDVLNIFKELSTSQMKMRDDSSDDFTIKETKDDIKSPVDDVIQSGANDVTNTVESQADVKIQEESGSNSPTVVDMKTLKTEVSSDCASSKATIESPTLSTSSSKISVATQPSIEEDASDKDTEDEDDDESVDDEEQDLDEPDLNNNLVTSKTSTKGDDDPPVETAKPPVNEISVITACGDAQRESDEKAGPIVESRDPVPPKVTPSVALSKASSRRRSLPYSPSPPILINAKDLEPPPPGYQSPFIFSLFPHVPPVLYFAEEGQKVHPLPNAIRYYLRWRTSIITPQIIKQILVRSHFKTSKYATITDELDNCATHDWFFYFGRHMKSQTFKTIREYQKVNHFPGSFQLGRKDRLWRNLYKMQTKFGKEEFGFFPQTFCLPTDLKLIQRHWEEGGSKHKWIIKPPASARGTGIRVISKWNQIPKKRPVIVQRYICNPYLINGSKFDLRIYVCVTSLEPLKIYLHEEGLARFASFKYSTNPKCLNNRFIHLTNYSINKMNVDYADNNTKDACEGHKWSLQALWSYLSDRGVDVKKIWSQIRDLVIKTLIATEALLVTSLRQSCRNDSSVYELFGFDVLLDEHLSPWILEVNISPSLHSNSALDNQVKGSMIRDLLNLVGYNIPDPEDLAPGSNPTQRCGPLDLSSYTPVSDLVTDRRLWDSPHTSEDRHRHTQFTMEGKLDPRVLDGLTPSDLRRLIRMVDEEARMGRFQRIFPASDSKQYLHFFDTPRYYNLLVISYVQKFGKCPLKGISLLRTYCERKMHLITLPRSPTATPSHSPKPSANKQPSPAQIQKTTSSEQIQKATTPENEVESQS